MRKRSKELKTTTTNRNTHTHTQKTLEKCQAEEKEHRNIRKKDLFS